MPSLIIIVAALLAGASLVTVAYFIFLVSVAASVSKNFQEDWFYIETLPDNLTPQEALAVREIERLYVEREVAADLNQDVTLLNAYDEAIAAQRENLENLRRQNRQNAKEAPQGAGEE
ncbi:MAG: hypothetical protein HY986_13335 [Candidatus Melainabacteria bacterium]|nr:hypothetical protein [Candidatus Melainabacteria bacterium]